MVLVNISHCTFCLPTDPNEQPPPYQPPAQPQPPPGQYYPAPNQYLPPQGQYPPPQRQYLPPQGQYPPPQGQYYPPPQYAPQPMQQQSSVSWIPSSTQYRIAGKFDEDLNLAVWRLGLKPPNYPPILFSPVMCNDVMHAVALLAPPGTRLRELYSLSLARFVQVSRARGRQHSMINTLAMFIMT